MNTEKTKEKKKMGLGMKILIGIVIGLAIGFISPSLAATLSPLGTIFLRLLKMLIVPLVFFSITSGITKMGDVKQLVSVGLRFIVWIVVTAGIAAFCGTIGGLVSGVGAGNTEFLDAGAAVEQQEYSFIDQVISWFPENIVDAMVNQNMLQIIIFCMFLGVALLVLGDKAKTFTDLINQGCDVMLKITDFVMAYSPIGIASLMATMVSTISGATVKDVVTFIAWDYIICILLLVAIYPVTLKFLAKLPVLKFFKKISEPMIVALSTTSSAATLPVSLKVAKEKLGIPENVYGFTLPLGNTMGMNGFAVFLGLCCVFCARLYGIDITFGRMFVYIFLGIVLSIGAAGVKGAGIVMTTVLLEAIGMPLSIVPIFAAIWPAIDPAHTLLNNTGDLVGTALVARRLNKMDINVFNKEDEAA